MKEDFQASIVAATSYYSPLGILDGYLGESYGLETRKLKVSEPLMTSYAACNLSLCIHTWSWNGQFTVFDS